MANDYDAPDKTPEGMELSPDKTWYLHDIDRILTGSDIPHGVDGHTGFRCIECAFEGDDPHPIYTPEQMVDTFQNSRLSWNEDCDSLREGHMIECAVPLDLCKKGHWPMPPRPTLPVERIR